MSQMPPGTGKGEGSTLPHPLSSGIPWTSPYATSVSNYSPFYYEASQKKHGMDRTGDLPWMAVVLRLSGHIASWPLARCRDGGEGHLGRS